MGTIGEYRERDWDSVPQDVVEDAINSIDSISELEDILVSVQDARFSLITDTSAEWFACENLENIIYRRIVELREKTDYDEEIMISPNTFESIGYYSKVDLLHYIVENSRC